MPAPASEPRRDLFGDIAVAKGMLTWAQIRDVLKRQLKYKEMGIPIRMGEVAVEMGVLQQTQVNDILAEQTKRRKAQGTGQPAKKADEINFDESTDDGQPFELGRFKLEKRLGGVMGTVYRSVDTATGQTIALKILPKTLARESAFVERFKREVKAMGILSHPNIVAIHDAGVEQGVFFMAAEFIDGESLNQRLRREGALPEREGLRIGLDVARALGHAHSFNVLHRDVKPENIMLTKNGDVKLADFGLAKLLADEHQITAEGIAVGTPHYIAPEQARALKETDHRADLYGLGATLFHVLTGRLPYEGDDGATIMRRHVFEPVPDPRTVKAGISAPAAEMLLKLMAKDPNQRFQSAAELCANIEKQLGVAPAAAPATPGGPPSPPPQSATKLSGMPRRRFAQE